MGHVRSRFLAHLPAKALVRPPKIPPNSFAKKTLSLTPTLSMFCARFRVSPSKQGFCDMGGGGCTPARYRPGGFLTEQTGRLWGERIGMLPVDERWFTIYFAQLPIAAFDSYELRVVPWHKPSGFDRDEAGEGEVSPSPASSPRWKPGESVRHVPGLKCQGCPRPFTSSASPQDRTHGIRPPRPYRLGQFRRFCNALARGSAAQRGVTAP